MPHIESGHARAAGIVAQAQARGRDIWKTIGVGWGQDIVAQAAGIVGLAGLAHLENYRCRMLFIGRGSISS